jgi:uncharacterized protein YtpQ (UPF0354 family)
MIKHIWSDYEIDYLLKNYPTKPIDEISEHLGLSKRQCREKACNMNLKKEIRTPYPRKYPDLTAEQESYFLKNYATKSRIEIANDLGINYKILRAYIERENLVKKVIKKEHVKKQVTKKHYKHPLYYNQIFGGIVGNEILKK